MKNLNHVDLEKLGETTKKIKADPRLAMKVNKVEGEWILDRTSGPQFKAVVKTESGEFTIEADQPEFLGGSGSAPGPMIYCLYGVAAYYLATFASIAASEGVKLNRLMIAAESHMDLSRPLGLAQNPTVDRVIFSVDYESDASEERMKTIENLARERCPAVYCLTSPIKLEIKAGIRKG